MQKFDECCISNKIYSEATSSHSMIIVVCAEFLDLGTHLRVKVCELYNAHLIRTRKQSSC